MIQRILCASVVAMFILTGRPANAAVVDFDDALYMHYQFDETKSALNGGTPWTYTEELANSLVAEVGQNVTPAAGGKIGNAFDFPGTGGSYVIAERPNLGATDATIGSQFSISAWVNSDVASYAHYARIVTNNWQNSFYLGTHGGTNQYQFIVNGAINQLDHGTIAPGSWQHVVGTYDGTNAVLYVDNVASSPMAMAAPAENAQTITIGANYGNAEHWDGKIDDVRIYNRALTPGEVGELFGFAGPNATRQNFVRNHSFEDEGNDPNTYHNAATDSPRVWQKTTATTGLGSFNPSTSYGGELSGGDGTPNFAYVDGNEATPRALFQDLLGFDDTPITYEAGTYELSVLLAGRADNPLVSGDSFTIALQTDADDPLVGTPLASLTVTDAQVNNSSFTDFSIPLVLSAGNTAIGDQIRVVVRANNGIWTADDVRLTLTSAQVVPEPSTFALLLVGAAGMALWRRRRR